MLGRKNISDIDKCLKACDAYERKLEKLSKKLTDHLTDHKGVIDKLFKGNIDTKEPQQKKLSDSNKLKEQVSNLSTENSILRNEIIDLKEENKDLRNDYNDLNQRFSPYEGKIDQIEKLFFPKFILNHNGDTRKDLKTLLEDYYTGKEDKPLCGLLLGQFVIINVAIKSPSLGTQLSSALRECGRLLVKMLEDDGWEAQEISETLVTISKDINPHLKKSNLLIRVPSVESIPDTTWMVYPPGSGKVSSIRSWCVSDLNGTTIFHAEVEC